MKNNFLRTLLLLVSSLAFLTACDKGNETAEPNKKDVLVAHEWKGDQVFINSINVAAIPGVGSNADTFKTLRLSFKEDNTYTATFSVRGQQQSFDGAWQLNSDETKLTLEMLGEFDLVTLTENNLDVTGLVSDTNVDFIARIMGINSQIINLVTGGAPVRTEMRFVK